LSRRGDKKPGDWAGHPPGDRFERSSSEANAKRLVYLKLMEKNQNTDPFKFIIYSGKIREQTPQMTTTK
jgi:hypothetical protein